MLENPGRYTLFVVVWSDRLADCSVFIFLVFLCDRLFSCGDFKYLLVVGHCVFNYVKFLQVRAFRSCICSVEIAYLIVWVWDLHDFSWVYFILNRSTTMI